MYCGLDLVKLRTPEQESRRAVLNMLQPVKGRALAAETEFPLIAAETMETSFDACAAGGDVCCAVFSPPPHEGVIEIQ